MKEERKTIEQHAEAQGTPAWAFAATKARMRWPALLEVSEREYTKAVAATLEGPMDGTQPEVEAKAEGGQA
jgi:hypothetical protein